MALLLSDANGALQAAKPVAAPAAAALKAAAAHAARPKAAAKPAAPAVAAAAKHYTGAFSGALNTLSDAEQRAHDVAARRQSDADAYQAWVVGKQGAIGAAAGQLDDKAIQQAGAVQTQTAGFQGAIGAAMQKARAAQGIQTPAPSQALGSVADAASATQAALGAGRQELADRANTNRGKAGFLAAAAQAALLANKRAIAGDEFDQTSSIRREKTGVLEQKTEATLADKRSQEQAAATAAAAQIRAQQDAADRSSREAIAQGQISSREAIAASGQQNARAIAKLRVAAAADNPAAKRQLRASNTKVRTAIETAAADARTKIGAKIPVTTPDGKVELDKNGKPTQRTRPVTQGEARASLRRQYKDNDIANAAMDLAVLGHISPTNIARLKARGIGVPKSWLAKPSKALSSPRAGIGASGSANLSG